MLHDGGMISATLDETRTSGRLDVSTDGFLHTAITPHGRHLPSPLPLKSPAGEIIEVEWSWDFEHEDRKREAKADAVVHGAAPFLVDRKLLKDVVKEKLECEVGRIMFLSSGTPAVPLNVAFRAYFPSPRRALLNAQARFTKCVLRRDKPAASFLRCRLGLSRNSGGRTRSHRAGGTSLHAAPQDGVGGCDNGLPPAPFRHSCSYCVLLRFKPVQSPRRRIHHHVQSARGSTRCRKIT
jgi:hypothetical protein